MASAPGTSLQVVTTVTQAPEVAPPSPSPRFSMESLERRWSSLSLASAFKKNKDGKHTELPPPYSKTDEMLAPPEKDQKAASVNQEDTWQTIPSTTTSDNPNTLPAPPKPDPVLEKKLLERATAFIRPLPSPVPSFKPLSKPIAIPRVNPGYNIPYARAWCPSLAESHMIDQATFLALIDNLNLISSPPLAVRAVELAAFAVGCVPIGEYSEGLSGALLLVALAATVALTRARTKAYMAIVNEQLLAPRGLHVQVLNTKKMRRALGVPKEEKMVLPLGEKTMGLSVQERCLQRLHEGGWSEEVVTDGLPELGKETRALARFAAWQVKREVKGADKSAEKCRKKAWKRHMKGKELKEGRVETRRVKSLDWIVIRNGEDVERERVEVEEEKGEKKGRYNHALWKCVRKG